MKRNFYFFTFATGVFILFFFVIEFSAYSQSDQDFFILTKKLKSTLNPKQLKITNELERNMPLRQMKYIKVGNLSKIQKDGTLTFKIPGKPEKYLAKATSVEYESEQNYSWFGTIESDKFDGEIIILSKDGQITAHISIGEEVYQIYHLDGGLHTLVNINTSALSGQCPSKSHKKEGVSSPKPEASEDKDSEIKRSYACVAPTRVLILSSPAARQVDSNISQTISLSIAQFNQALTNSSVANVQRLELAAYVPITFSERQDQIFEDTDLLSTMPNVQNLRAQYKADLVVLLTNGNYKEFSTGGSYYGNVKNIGPSASDAFGIVEVTRASSKFTFAHEVGHMYGGRHENDTEGVPYSHGYKYDVRKWPFVYRYTTIMHNLVENRSMRTNFSNPNVKHDGVAMGNAEYANVARLIAETSSVVNNFQPVYAALKASIIVPSYVALYQTYTWEALYSCGQGPYRFEWYMSSDGVNYSYASNSETIRGSFYSCSERKYFRLKVYSADGQVATAYATSSPSCTARRELTEMSMDASPNPATEKTEVSFSLPETQQIRLEIFDFQGNSVEVLEDAVLKAGSYKRKFRSDNLAPGIYLCRIICNGFQKTKKIIIAQ
ncbi:MAG TPA: zinc-dependent metalloprotease [Cytophagales bacterium]|nr:zinc-dependent metalloprotease [Cytophagales bacterium]